ncbi:hypothetical protein SKAU_G00195440 [Synaphobranchus kaupii]|uniref:Uncharacterized protein n=1 Tax=Synaphobranchus kaupii TaxID=118154 RepID=A0A9Q1FES5_SYNKA|nr:hypothetical protein SKAU_G00195440 [Synaphobranchus kaupii]
MLLIQSEDTKRGEGGDDCPGNIPGRFWSRPDLTYGGFTNEPKSGEQLLELVESLQRDGLTLEEKHYYTAGYDSPFKLTNRLNEVWLFKKPDVCSNCA